MEIKNRFDNSIEGFLERNKKLLKEAGEFGAYEQAISGQEQALASQEASYADQMPQIPQQIAVQNPNIGMMQDPNMMGFAPVDDSNVGDSLKANDSYRNILIFKLMIEMRDIAKRLKEKLNLNLAYDQLNKSTLYKTHNTFVALDSFIEQLEYYIDNQFEYNEYEHNLKSYLAYRNAYVKIIKELKTTLEV